MAKRPTGPFNRNAAIGDFEAFAPERRTLDDLIQGKHPKVDPLPARTSRELLCEDGYALVRYKVDSPEVQDDLRRLSRENRIGMASSYPTMAAAFGVIRREDDAPVLYFEATASLETGICEVAVAPEHGIPPEALLRFLNYVDVPPRWNTGTEAQIALLLDAWYAPDDGGWITRDPLHVVIASYERMCFGTRPTLSETIDVMLLPESGQNLDDEDPDAAYWAKSHYRALGFDHLPANASMVRPGFSSWLQKGDPQMAKVVDDTMYQTVREMIERRSADDTATGTLSM